MKLQKYKTMKTLAVAALATAVLSTGAIAGEYEDNKEFISHIKGYKNLYNNSSINKKKIYMKYCNTDNIAYNYKAQDLYNNNVKQFKFLIEISKFANEPKHYKKIKNKLQQITSRNIITGNYYICLTDEQRKQLGE